ncbi:MAG: hypothetical protein ACRDRL_31490 [Sciscionella sp.]
MNTARNVTASSPPSSQPTAPAVRASTLADQPMPTASGCHSALRNRPPAVRWVNAPDPCMAATPPISMATSAL